MARNVAKVLSASDCETQNINDYKNNKVNLCKRKKKTKLKIPTRIRG